MRVRVDVLPDPPRRSDGRIDLDQLVARLHRLGPVDVLESAPGHPQARRWSYVIPRPRAVLISDRRSVRLVRQDAPDEPLVGDAFQALNELGDRADLTPETERDPDLPPLTGGLVGAVSYDVAAPAHRADGSVSDRDHLLVHLSLAEVVVAVDDDVALVIERRLLGGEPDPDLGRVLDALRTAVPIAPTPRPGRQVAVTTLPETGYRKAVLRVLEHIAAGDVYQVNLSQRITARWDAGTHALYRALRQHSPAPHGAVIETCGIASVSPETFLRVEGEQVTVRPIKGTRPRAVDPDEDAAVARELLSSDKDRAENVMVVDMERNDLGRVCRVGSVHVPELVVLERHPTVWHLVSTVQGRLAPGTGWGTLLRATFPCGSVTGTPKVRAMQVIDDLEPVKRSWYCGTIGFLSAGGADTSVAIRTAVLGGGLADYGAGGGVVADSDPASEHAESLDKAAAFLSATNATVGDDRDR